jgi:hypothetical protein
LVFGGGLPLESSDSSSEEDSPAVSSDCTMGFSTLAKKLNLWPFLNGTAALCLPEKHDDLELYSKRK